MGMNPVSISLFIIVKVTFTVNRKVTPLLKIKKQKGMLENKTIFDHQWFSLALNHH